MRLEARFPRAARSPRRGGLHATRAGFGALVLAAAGLPVPVLAAAGFRALVLGAAGLPGLLLAAVSLRELVLAAAGCCGCASAAGSPRPGSDPLRLGSGGSASLTIFATTLPNCLCSGPVL